MEYWKAYLTWDWTRMKPILWITNANAGEVNNIFSVLQSSADMGFRTAVSGIVLNRLFAQHRFCAIRCSCTKWPCPHAKLCREVFLLLGSMRRTLVYVAQKISSGRFVTCGPKSVNWLRPWWGRPTTSGRPFRCSCLQAVGPRERNKNRMYS